MSILLVNAPYEPGDDPIARIQGIGCESTLAPHLGLGYLAAVLIEAGFEPRCVDLMADPVSRDDLIASLDPDRIALVGISCMTCNYPAAVALGRRLREAKPGLKIVVGGPHVSYRDEEALRSGAFDVVVRHEGEITLRELAKHWLRGEGSLQEILGISFLSSEGELVRTQSRPPIEDLDRLPLPAYHLAALDHYRSRVGAQARIITARGCLFRCRYCSAGAFHETARYRSVGEVLRDVERVKSLGFSTVQIADDNLFVRGSYLGEFLDGMERLGVAWTANIVASKRVDDALLRRCKEAGAVGFLIGVESGSDRILEEIKRPNRIATVLEVAERIRANGFSLSGAVIVGHAGETQESLEETNKAVDRLRQLGVRLSVYLSTPFPGTFIEEHAEKLGLKIRHRNWEFYTLGSAVADTREFSAEQLAKIRLQLQARARFGVGGPTALINRIDFSNPKQLEAMAGLLEKITGSTRKS